jgi:hypothetical protein
MALTVFLFYNVWLGTKDEILLPALPPILMIDLRYKENNNIALQMDLV